MFADYSKKAFFSFSVLLLVSLPLLFSNFFFSFKIIAMWLKTIVKYMHALVAESSHLHIIRNGLYVMAGYLLTINN